MAEVKTLTFNEGSNGWTSFWDYEPLFMFSMNGRYYSINEHKLHKHYDELALTSNFYGTQYDSEVTLIFNEAPSVVKNFKTVNYEGSNGWEMESFISDEYAPLDFSFDSDAIVDLSKPVKSYSEGAVVSRGRKIRVGFNKKENKYFANLKNNSVILREGEVRSGAKISGIKGVFSSVKMKTDSSTDLGGVKQLFAVSTEYVVSSM